MRAIRRIRVQIPRTKIKLGAGKDVHLKSNSVSSNASETDYQVNLHKLRSSKESQNYLREVFAALNNIEIKISTIETSRGRNAQPITGFYSFI